MYTVLCTFVLVHMYICCCWINTYLKILKKCTNHVNFPQLSANGPTVQWDKINRNTNAHIQCRLSYIKLFWGPALLTSFTWHILKLNLLFQAIFKIYILPVNQVSSSMPVHKICVYICHFAVTNSLFTHNKTQWRIRSFPYK